MKIENSFIRMTRWLARTGILTTIQNSVVIEAGQRAEKPFYIIGYF